MRITVVGTGYVGLVTGTCFADMGNEVTCQDVDTDKITRLNRGEVPIYEPGLEEMVRRNQADDRLSFTTDLAEALVGAEICFVAVGTPPDEEGAADKRFVNDAIRTIGRHMQGPLVIVIKSTVPVGTADQMLDVVRGILQERGEGFEVDVVSNPEFLKEGKAIEDFMRPDRIVVGSHSPWAAEVMRSAYSHFIRNGHAYLEMNVRSSEMTKYAANVMLATRISLMNEMAQVCDQVGADIMEVRKGVGTDTRIGMPFLYAGAGFGGSCFPKDVLALSRMAKEADCPADILEAVSRVNSYQKLLLANRIIGHFGGDVRGRRFGLWGLAFKPKTDDIRAAPALTILKRLTDAGAHVCAYDPQAVDNARAHLQGNDKVSFAAKMYDALEGADALVLATEWAQFRKPDFERIKTLLRTPVIFDGRNQYEIEEMESLGFSYHCIGRSVR